MKVIKNNFNKINLNKKELPKSIHMFCEHCISELEVVPEDTHIGCFGAPYVTCPCCKKETMVDRMDGITLTKDNIEFPRHFFRINKTLGAIELSNHEIEHYVNEGITSLRINKEMDHFYCSTGDTEIVIYKLDEDEEYYISVSKDSYVTYIPFEDMDYNEEVK